MAQVAERESELMGTPVSYLDETRASCASYGAPDWQVEAWISSYAAIASGALEEVTDIVARLAGHEPITLAEVVRRRRD